MTEILTKDLYIIRKNVDGRHFYIKDPINLILPPSINLYQ